MQKFHYVNALQLDKNDYNAYCMSRMCILLIVCVVIKRIGETAWVQMPVISALGRLRQKDYEFKASWGSIARPCLKNKNKLKIKNK
jgi:hypothetical protein